MAHQPERRQTPTKPPPEEDEEENTRALLDTLARHVKDEDLLEEIKDNLGDPESLYSDRKWGRHEEVLNFVRMNWPKLLNAYLDDLHTTEAEVLQSWKDNEPSESPTNDISQFYLLLFIFFSEEIQNEDEDEMEGDEDDSKYDPSSEVPRKTLPPSRILSGLIFDAYQKHFLGSDEAFLCFPKSNEQFYHVARIFDIDGAKSDRKVARDQGDEIRQHVIRDRPGKSDMFRDRRASEILPFRMANEGQFDEWVEIATGFYGIHRALFTGENQHRHCAVVFVFQMNFGSDQEGPLWHGKEEELSWTNIEGHGREFWSQKFLDIRDEIDPDWRLSVVLIRCSGFAWQYHVLKTEEISRAEHDMFYTSFRGGERTRMFSALNQRHGENNMSLISENQPLLKNDLFGHFVRGYMVSGGVQWRVRSAQELGQVLNLFRPCVRERLVLEDDEIVEDCEANDVLTQLNDVGWFTRR